ncbi:hypothetical protein ScalyP_jg1617, partial [Parmales sp. scaly parma]
MGMSGALNSVYKAYKYFQRDEEIDELERKLFIDSMDSTPATSIEEKTLINRSLQFADMLNLGGGNQRQDATAGMDSNKRMKWTRLHDGDLSFKKFKKMKEGDSSVFYERNGLVVDAELRAEFVKNVPKTVNLITAEQKPFVQQEMESIDYKDETGWEKLDKDSSVFVKLSKKHNKGESNAW